MQGEKQIHHHGTNTRSEEENRTGRGKESETQDKRHMNTLSEQRKGSIGCCHQFVPCVA
jgi:hypothetical protein